MWDIRDWVEKQDKKVINSIKQIIELQKNDLNRKRKRIQSVLKLSEHTNPFDLLECLIELVERTARGKVDNVIVNAVKRALQKDIQEEEEDYEEDYEEEEEEDYEEEDYEEEEEEDYEDGRNTVGEVIKEMIERDEEGKEKEKTERLLKVKGKGFSYSD